jgi:UPF0755 protein
LRDPDTVPLEPVTATTVFHAATDEADETTVFPAHQDETTVLARMPGSDAGPGAPDAAAGPGDQDVPDPADHPDGIEPDEAYDEEPDDVGRRHRSKRRGPLIVLAVFASIIVGGGYLLYSVFFGAPDYEGNGQGDVIIQVNDGDTLKSIGAALTRADVVRSAKAFTRAAADDDERARSVQPGYYRLKLRMSGPAAVKLMLDPRSRVGQLDIKGGVQLDDTRGPDGTVAAGLLTQLAQGTCTQLNGTPICVSVDQLRDAMAKAPLESLGVPDWARTEVAKADPNRRLEGLVAPGRYDVRPGISPQEMLRTLVSRSAAQYEASGLVTGARESTYSPYQTLVIASLIEKEGITGDFGKISQVIHNRLTSRVRLELDSTVNYPLDLQAVRTNSTDRGRAGPYNSYANYGLPPTPIGSPGTKAIDAALHPEPGPWMFFVKCRPDGTSCFATTLPEHQGNVRTAQAAGVF